jgi:hypothetical protein
MQKYEAMRPLLEFLVVPKTNKKHWSDNFGWMIVKFMHHEVLLITKAIVGATHHIVFNCDEVSTLDI